MGGPLVPLEGGYRPPGIEDFEFPGLFGTDWITKPMVQLVLSVILISVVWLWAARKLNVVPTKGQFIAEYLYDFIRNGVAREMIGRGYQRWTPFLVAVFFYILVNNWFGEFFLFMFPTFSNIGYSYGVTLLVFVIYVFVGVQKHGLPKYFKNSVLPAGVPVGLWAMIIPIEFISNFVTRPLTLAVRLFANMFAGHLSVLVFVVGGGYLLTYVGNAFYNVVGVLSLVMGMLIMALELFIGFLQAYIFTILSAQYIGSSQADSH